MSDPVTMGSIGFFGSVLKGLQALQDLVGSVEAKAKVVELYDLVLAGQRRALESDVQQRQLLDTVRGLEEKIASMEAWNAEKQRYVLKALGNGGAVVYALKKSASNSEPPHWICATCYQNGTKGFINIERSDRRDMLFCSTANCQAHIKPAYRGRTEIKYAEDME